VGVSLKDLVVKKEISIQDLNDKKLVVDGNNILYQFLATIRQMDGTPLMDAHGNITSHLTGLFHRSTRLMQNGIKLAFVFDGAPPKLKVAERKRRADLKKDAQQKYEDAKSREDMDAMKKYSMRTSRLTREMIDEATDLISAMGLPVVKALSEGEAQAAHMVKKGEVFAEISQDYDCLLFGVPRMVQNLTISERRKKKDRLSYETVKPQLLLLDENLWHLGISNDQLIALGMLVGTDFNVGGIKGIGPKKAFDLVKKHGEDFSKLFKCANWDDYFDYSWQEVFDLFKNMPVKEDYDLRWNPLDPDKVCRILCERHDFSRQRVEDTLAKLDKSQSRMAQKGLGDFI
jgi:flap endonuclease-1